MSARAAVMLSLWLAASAVAGCSDDQPAVDVADAPAERDARAEQIVPPDQALPDTARDAAPSDGGVGDLAAGDIDGDGIDDATELTWARAYYPYYAVASDDGCPLHGVLFRLSPHPADASLIMIWYVELYAKDCGALGHVGDDETFGVVADPTVAPPAGILAVRAISHQSTPCQHISTCGTLKGCSACATATRAGAAYPVVFASRNKHGQYTDKATCDGSFICDFGGCGLPPAPDDPPFVNAGEPGHPLTNDLTSGGFITTQNGWTDPKLQGFDPWGGADFGGAGSVTSDLTDSAFVVDPNGC